MMNQRSRKCRLEAAADAFPAIYFEMSKIERMPASRWALAAARV
jgi:hypothetical protein